MVKRVQTGIKGFDKLVQGGLPENSVTLLIGTPGTGKTLFSLQYLHNGATNKEKSMYVTLEQSLEDIRSQAKDLGMDLAKAEKTGMLTLMHIPIHDLTLNTIEQIKKEAEKRKIKRLVIDSISTLAVNAPVYTPLKDLALRDVMNYKAFFSPPILGDFVVKRFIYGFLSDLKQLGCTTIVTGEAPEKGEFLTRDTVSEFIADGIVSITFESMGGQYSRSLLVRKMRGTKADEDIHPLEITDKGLVIHTVK
ncbi:AAA family ATPase [Candidatus Woesearchaeota archaeon]|nr:AAA family ATPase [Candidatus Woesearchaeota archaeon]